jgi:hypothetical protein
LGFDQPAADNVSAVVCSRVGDGTGADDHIHEQAPGHLDREVLAGPLGPTAHGRHVDDAPDRDSVPGRTPQESARLLFLRPAISTVTPYADSAEVFYAFLGAVGIAILLVGIAASMIHAGHYFNLHHAMDIPLRYVFL